MGRRDALGKDPLSALGPLGSSPEAPARPPRPPARPAPRTGRARPAPLRARRGKAPLRARVDAQLLATVYSIAYWDRETLSSVIEQGLRLLVAEREDRRGEPYPPPLASLRKGRPLSRR